MFGAMQSRNNFTVVADVCQKFDSLSLRVISRLPAVQVMHSLWFY